MEQVVLVDSNDNPIGSMEKMEAHRKGALHRAFSILLFNKEGELLIQKRAEGKYHSGNLWTNTCCSHQKPGEDNLETVKRRLFEEMGITAEVEEIYKFIYRYEFHPELIEHELDHVYVGQTKKDPKINTSEVSDWKWVSWSFITKDIKENDNQYTFWFKEIIIKLQLSPSLLPQDLQLKIT